MFRFEKLDVWQAAVELADIVYRIGREFPNDERYGLTSQVRRSAVSIAANIAEESAGVRVVTRPGSSKLLMVH